jgi:transposase
VRDEYKAYERVVAAEPGRLAARCLAPARSMFDELLRDNGKNAVTTEALQCITRI